jgi:hypothetical protein
MADILDEASADIDDEASSVLQDEAGSGTDVCIQYLILMGVG